MLAGRRRTSVSAPTAPSCSSRRSATDERSADLLFRVYRRILPHNFGDEKPFSSLRRASSTRRSSPWPPATWGCARRRLRAFATAEPNGYVLAYEAIEGRSLDRLDPSEVSDEVLAAIWDLVGSTPRPPHRPPRPAPGEHLPRRRRSRLAHRLRLQRGRRLRSVARHRRRRADGVVERLRRAGTGRRPRRGRGRPRDAGAGAPTGSTRGPSAARPGRRSRPGRACSTISAAG